MPASRSERTEIGVVLQGGGALGAYEHGAIIALLELMEQAAGRNRDVALTAVTGVSIGAINAACLVGSASRFDARRRLAALWNDLVLETPLFWPQAARRDLALYGLPHFYSPRSDIWSFPNWTYLYNTHPLLPTLSRHIDFDALNQSDTALVVTAVDVETGVLKRFSNKKLDKTERTIIEPQHVLASGSLPPQFPWTDIKEGGRVRHYWDGGIVDNTPLTDAIDAFSIGDGVRRLLVVMNLFPQNARLPSSLFEVTERVDELRFGNRVHQDARSADRINRLAATIDALAALVSVDLPPELALAVAKARALKQVETIELTLDCNSVPADDYGFRDFSREGVEARKAAGRSIAFEALQPAFDSI